MRVQNHCSRLTAILAFHGLEGSQEAGMGTEDLSDTCRNYIPCSPCHGSLKQSKDDVRLQVQNAHVNV